MEAGADIFRLNMSHAKHEWVREIVPRIRQIAAAIPRPVAILLDTQGPAIRTGELKTNLELKPGDILEFTVRGAQERREVFGRRELRRPDQRHFRRRHRSGRQRCHADARPGEETKPHPLQSADAGRARLAPPHQSPGGARESAAADGKGPGRCRARRGAEGRFRRAQFCPQEERPRGAAAGFEESEQHRADRGENRGSIGRAA